MIQAIQQETWAPMTPTPNVQTGFQLALDISLKGLIVASEKIIQFPDGFLITVFPIRTAKILNAIT